MDSPSSASVHDERGLSASLTRTLANLALQDWGALFFHTFMTLRVMVAPNSPEATTAREFSLVLLGVTATTLALTRGELIKNAKLRAFVYRVGLFAPMPGSYFALKSLLPALQPQLVDDTLHNLDVMLLGVTPSVWLTRFNSPRYIEWFAFFYYSYFWLLAFVLLPSLFFDRGRRLVELMLGGFIVCACAHIGYTLVPGAGPHAAIDFAEPIHGGFWWSQVEHTVAVAGAQLDIFPSLHTGYPAYFAIHAFMNRHEKPYRYTWPILAFFSANIIVATLLLRWHWFVDVLAGLTLAFMAQRIAHHFGPRECARGADGDPRQPVWEPLFR